MHRIYLITNLITSDTYVGQTKLSLSKRFNNHCSKCKNPKTYLHRAIAKYGKESFNISLLEETELPNTQEPLWIEKLKPTYNMTKGGEGGDTSKSPNYISAIESRVLKMTGANNHFFGKTHTIETKEKISKAKLGIRLSEDTKKKISISNLGKKLSAESIKKRSEKNSRYWLITFPDGSKQQIKNLNQFCRDHNLSQANMIGVAKGTYNSSKGFKCQKI